jgi:hypothetical protein
MAALPGSGVRPDQALAIAQAFEQLINNDTVEKKSDAVSAKPRR